MSKLYAYSVMAFTVTQHSILSEATIQTAVILADSLEYAIGAAYKMAREKFPKLLVQVDAMEISEDFIAAAHADAQIKGVEGEGE